MNGSGMGRGPGHGHGRRRMERHIRGDLESRCFAPICRCDHEEEPVYLRHDEMELLRLTDLEGLSQEEAAGVLGVSRKTVWRDLHEARRKLAYALINGRIIAIGDCSEHSEGRCQRFGPSDETIQ